MNERLREVLRPWMPHLLLIPAVLIMTIPFINKAVHIDDTIYIYAAKQILLDPLRPYDFEINWMGVTTRAIDAIFHPPLLSYYFSLFIALLGESEPVLHGCLVVFPLLAAYSAYFLARRFTPYPLHATLLLIFAPPFFVGASSLMLDIPVLALVLAATALFIHGIDTADKKILNSAGVILGAAFLIKDWAALQFFFLGFYAFQRSQTKEALIALGLGGILAGGWIVFNSLVSGETLPFLSGGWAVKIEIPVLEKMGSLISFLGGSTLILGCFSPRRKENLWLIFYFLLSCIFFAIHPKGEMGILSLILLFLFLLNGVIILARVLSSCKDLRILKDPDNQFLLFWLITSIVFIILIVPYSAMRHILIFLMPLHLLLFRLLPLSGRFQTSYYFNLSFLFCLSLAVSLGDYHFSNTYRTYANTLYKKIDSSNNDLIGKEENSPGPDSGEKPAVWILTHWGFQYYMENRGAEILGVDNLDQIREGDWLVDTREAHKNFLPAEVKSRFQLVEEFHSNHWWPVRIMNRALGAGWYAQMWGPLPFSLGSNVEMETFSLYRAGKFP